MREYAVISPRKTAKRDVRWRSVAARPTNFHATIQFKNLWKIGNFALTFDVLIRKKLKELKDRYRDAVHQKGRYVKWRQQRSATA